jgi:hypothetical protein
MFICCANDILAIGIYNIIIHVSVQQAFLRHSHKIKVLNSIHISLKFVPRKAENCKLIVEFPVVSTGCLKSCSQETDLLNCVSDTDIINGYILLLCLSRKESEFSKF